MAMVAHAHSLPTQFQLIETSLPLLHSDPRSVESKPRPYIVPEPPEKPSGQSEEVRQLRSSLEAAIASRITSGSELIRALAKERREEIRPTTLLHADALLGGGLSRGKMTEIVGRAGRFSLVQATLAAATSIGEAAALIDLGDHFDPQLGEAAGIDLRRLLWIRPHTLKQAVMAAEMITATGFQLVVLDAGLHPVRGRRVPDASWVRLARAAEAHGTAMLISTPYAFTGTTSEAVLHGEKTRVKWLGQGKSPRLLAGLKTQFTLDKHRHLKPGATAICDLRFAITT